MVGRRGLLLLSGLIAVFCFVALYALRRRPFKILRQMEMRPFPEDMNSRELSNLKLVRYNRTGGGIRRPPDFIIIGARKCGTRALLSMINLHPGIVTTGPEVHFFDKDENYRKGISWYIEQMAKSREGQLTGEKSPKYFIAPGVPTRIKNYSRTVQKNVKLLLVVRNPVDRVISDYAQGLDKREVDLSGTKKVREEFNRRAFDQRTGDVNSQWGAISVSQYSTHLSRWLEEFSFEQLHIIDGDKLVTDPANQMKKVDGCCSYSIIRRL
jgi:[heparan sulfate]-glucosamine 3-sulfotransferase 5